MHILFKRSQTSVPSVRFSLWCKIDATTEENDLIKRYSMKSAVLISRPQPGLLQLSILIGVVVFLVLGPIWTFALPRAYSIGLPWPIQLLLSLAVSAGAAYAFFNEKRETIMVSDLLVGRTFKCKSVIELARKEAYLQTITEYFRQVLESAKHWGDAESIEIHPLDRDEAKRRILSGPLL